jgi:two-component system, NarL family, sensor kinase
MKNLKFVAACILGIFLLGNHSFANKTDSLLSIVKQTRTDKEALHAWKNLCVYTSRNDPQKTFDFVRAAQRVAVRLMDSSSYALFWKDYGIAHMTLGSRDSAAWYYFKSIEILERNKDLKVAAGVYNDVARMLRRDEPDRAISYYQKAMDIYRGQNDEEGMATIWNESGIAFEVKGDLEEAENRYKKSLEIQLRRKDTVGISYALSFLSGVKATKKEFKESEKLALEALRLREIIKDSFALAIAVTNMGEFYNLTGSYEEAIPFFERSNAIAKNIQFADIMAHNHGQLAEAWEKSGNYKMALAEKNNQTNLKDSLFQLNKEKQILEITTKYETVEKEKQLQEQAFALTRKNYIIAIVSLALLLSSLGAGWIIKRKQYKHREALEREKRVQQEMASREVMKAEENERRRIAAELHDGVGQLMSAARMNLEVIATELEPLSFDKRQKLEKVIGLVDESCKEVRVVSHQMMPNALLKKGLGNALQDFISKIDNAALAVQLHIEGLQQRLNNDVETVLYRVIQECVNNVIKHSKADTLDISLIHDEDGIAVTIEDNGIGFDPMLSHEGIGIQNMKARIQFLKGSIDFDSVPGSGTVIAIHIPPENI